MGRVAIYCRVSTADQNCDRQEAELIAYANRLQHNVVTIARETASGRKSDRIERSKIIDMAKSGKIDTIIVSELTRWGRSTIDLIMTIEQLASWGCALKSLNGMDFDPQSAHGQLMLTVVAGVAQFERALIIERVRSGIAHAKAKGTVLGRPVVDVTSRCREVNRLKQQNFSVRAIAKELKISKSAVDRCRCGDVPEGMDW